MSLDQSLQGAVSRAIAFLARAGEPTPSANTAAYSKARERLPDAILPTLTKDTGRELEEQSEQNWLWRNRHVKLVDGSTLTMTDTKKNQEEFPQPKSQKAGIGFPIARVVAIISCATGAVLNFAMGPYRGKGTGEHGLLREIMDTFQKGDIVLGDAYYGSFFLFATLMQAGVDAVFPIHGARESDFRKGLRLGKKDHLAIWTKPARPEWMGQDQYDEFPDMLKLREVEVQIQQDGYKTKSKVLVTTLINPEEVSKKDLLNLYGQRWFIEIDFRSIKDTMQMGVLRSKSPSMIRKEIWAHLLAYNLIRKVMAQSASIYNRLPRKLSFKFALQIINDFRIAGLFRESNKEAYNKILLEISKKTIGKRPGRREPRVVKRRPKPFPRMQKRRGLYKSSRR